VVERFVIVYLTCIQFYFVYASQGPDLFFSLLIWLAPQYINQHPNLIFQFKSHIG